MKLGLIVLGTVVLAGSVTLGQTAMKDIADMERKLQDAQVALTRLVPSTLERDLRELQDELAYLRVKERRGESITTTERRNLNDRVDRYMSRLSPSRSGLATSRENAPAVGGRSIPSATEIDVRLQTRLSSNDGMVEDRVEATTMVDLYRGDDLLVPAGSLLVGHVTAVDKATRTDRKGSLTIAFTRLTSNGRTRDVRASVTQAIESDGMKGEAGRVGAGAGVGAIIGGILGGVKGAITGILIGGGGVLVATEGKDVELPPGTILRVRFDSAVALTE